MHGRRLLHLRTRPQEVLGNKCGLIIKIYIIEYKEEQIFTCCPAGYIALTANQPITFGVHPSYITVGFTLCCMSASVKPPLAHMQGIDNMNASDCSDITCVLFSMFQRKSVDLIIILLTKWKAR